VKTISSSETNRKKGNSISRNNDCIANRHYSGHHKATEEGDLGTLGEGTWE